MFFFFSNLAKSRLAYNIILCITREDTVCLMHRYNDL